ncbi:MAG: ABC transporter ATP-binding protein [Myxococcota bacterium]|nr:ABC transporter ATP-binding protein [Myxococcota bacterium]
MIVLDKVSKYYGERAAVRDASFSIQAGEVVGLLGLNGAGKTTTLKMLAGVLLPTAGRITVDGIDLMTNVDAVRARIGFLPEVPPLYPEMRVAEYLTFVAHIKGLKNDVAGHVDTAIADTDLGDVRNEFIGTLSNGFQRRVGIAQALVHRPALIVLDEPTAGLDPKQMVHMRALIRKLKERHTVLVSSHILNEIEHTCDRLIVIDRGRIAAMGTEAELAGSVSGATSIVVEIRGARGAFEAAVRQSGVVAKTAIDREEDGIIVATLELSTDARETLAQALVGAGLGLRRMERVQLELESIFLTLTGNRAQSAAA